MIAVALSLSAGAAPQQPQPQRAPGTLTEGVTAVLVDVVVRDRRGQPVKDLTAADFEVLEDGVPQALGSFTPIFNAAAAGPSADTKPATPAPTAPTVGTAPPTNEGPLLTALVFDRLSPEARRLAVQAAQGYLGNKEQAPAYFGVFRIDLALAPYAPFTRNAHALREALKKVESGASASFASPEQREQRANAERRAGTAAAGADAAISAGGPGTAAAVGGAAGEAILAQMSVSMERDFELMERDQQGYATTNALFAIINAMRNLPGRKSLVLFSEGVAIPPAVLRLFAGVIDAANRASVSIYTVDAAGLRTASEQAKIRDEVNLRAGGGGGILSGNVEGPLSKELEKNEDVLRQDPRTGLDELATATGGLLFESTNNLRQAFDRIEGDLRNYYLLGYTPTNDNFDGKFRTIQVRVKRSGLAVAARKGYFAVRDPGGVAINAWDAAALGALEQQPVPNAFPVRVAALHFPERGRPGLTPTLVQFATSKITFQPASDGKRYTSDFTVLVRFLDEEKRVARTVSQHYEIDGPLSEMARAQQGEVIFYREPELLPGVYSMETVVHDAASGASSARFATVEVPKPVEGALRVSSLVLARRVEKVSGQDRRADNPLVVNDLVIQPNLGDPVSKGAKEVGFYFAIYPADGGAPEAVIELLRNGQLVARVPMPAGKPDASRRIQQLGRLPLDQLQPGTYDLRAVVKQGDAHVVRSTLLRLVE